MTGDLRSQLARIRDKMFPRRMCAKKKRYVSKEYADSVIRFRQPNEPEQLYCYQCPDCNGWHLTKLSQPEHLNEP